MRRLLPGVILLAAGLAAGGWLLGRAARRQPQPELTPTRLFEQVLAHVQRFGVDSLPEPELYRRAADGLVRQLNDEYAAILPERARSQLEQEADAGGLGLLLSTRGGRAVVLAVLPGSPADLAGLRPGDHLLEVNGTPTDPVQHDELLALLGGPPGTVVEIQARRAGTGALATWRVTRQRPRAAAVSPAVRLEGSVGYIAVGLIGRGAAGDVAARLAELTRSGATRLILDLRGASQGDLEEAVRLASLFLDRGAPVVEIRGRGPEPRRLDDRDPQSFAALPLVVLVDGSTADAAEVVAGALQDNDRALLVGQPTYGRGLSPEVFPLGDRMVVRISTGRWFTPAGRPIQMDRLPDELTARPAATTRGGRTVLGGGGIVPDSVVPPDTLTDASRLLFRALDSHLPEYYAALQGTAAAIVAAGPVAEGFAVTPDHRERLLAALNRTGAYVPRELFDGAPRRIGRDLGDAVVRLGRGEAALLRHRTGRDPVVRLARTLLDRAATPGALVGPIAARP